MLTTHFHFAVGLNIGIDIIGEATVGVAQIKRRRSATNNALQRRSVRTVGLRLYLYSQTMHPSDKAPRT